MQGLKVKLPRDPGVTTRHTGCMLTLATASAKRAADFKLRLVMTLALCMLRDRLRLQKGGRMGFLAG